MRKITIPYIMSLALALVFLSSCNDLPTDMGSPLLFDTVGAKSITSNDYPLITKTFNFVRKKSRMNQNAMYIGQDPVSGLKSGGVFIFSGDNIDTTLHNKIKSGLTSVQLKLYPYEYILGDTASKFLSFDIYKIKKNKMENFKWVYGLQYDDIISTSNNYYDPSQKVGSYTGSLVTSYLDSIYIDIDKNLMMDWLTNDYVTATDTFVNWGLVIVPREESKCIRRFRSPAPGTGDSVNYNSQLVINYSETVDNTLDTVTYLLPSSVESPFTGVFAPSNPNEILVQAGVEQSTLMYFDVSQIPTNASIILAQLELTINREKSVIGTPDYKIGYTSLMCYNLPYKYLGYKAEDVPLSSLSKYGGLYQSGDKFIFNEYFFEVIEDWVYNKKEGYLWFFFADTYNKLDKLVFYGMDEPDVNKRPKLKIMYSLKPKLAN